MLPIRRKASLKSTLTSVSSSGIKTNTTANPISPADKQTPSAKSIETDRQASSMPPTDSQLLGADNPTVSPVEKCESAATRVFKITELLEKILEKCDLRTLLC